MERLTQWYDDGKIRGVLVKDGYEENALQTIVTKIDECYAAVALLKEYEDTGLTPERIMELKERDTAKAPKICKNKHSNAYTCPNCALELINKDETRWFCGKHYKFCPDCGQRLKWED